MARPVLIIEDDPDIAEILRYGLENVHLETRVALTVEEGLSASLDIHNPPSLTLLDLLLPGMSGIELCRRLRSESLTRKDIATTQAFGVDDFFIKPFSLREVIARVHSLLHNEPC